MGHLRVKNLGKAYKRYPRKWGRAMEWLGMGMQHELKWVLRDISFEVAPGEAVGIIGVNGAGKSTLLKIITDTTKPTTGFVEVSGRISALLELGIGFHPDFTGRQNVYMAAQLRGMGGDEISAKMWEIEDFAEIGDYIDQPVRTYSSGMQMRLAFAVATASRPDILIVDEALAVGDAAFQRKCFQRIENYCDMGTTLLFVSHSIETVKRLCNKAVFVHHGIIRAIGNAKSVCDEYEQVLFGSSTKTNESIDSVKKLNGMMDLSLNVSSIAKEYGDGGAIISSVAMLNESQIPVNVIPEGSSFFITYRIKFLREVVGAKFGMMIKAVDGICVSASNTANSQLQDSFSAEDEISVCFELQGNLVPGTYYLNVGSTHNLGDKSEFLHRRVDCLIFRVTSINGWSEGGHANLFAKPSISILGGKGKICGGGA